MFDKVRIKIFRDTFNEFFSRLEVSAFGCVLILFTLGLYLKAKYFTPNDQNLVSIVCSLWATLIFYMVFEVYGKTIDRVKKIKLFFIELELVVKAFDRVHGLFLDEISKGTGVNIIGPINFFCIVGYVKQNYTPTSNLRMLKPGPKGLIPYDIMDSCIYHFDNLKLRLEKLLNFSRTLQVVHEDHKLFKKLSDISSFSPVSRSLVMKTPSKNPHCALASDIDLLFDKLYKILEYLDYKYLLKLKITENYKK